jgi:hypothetical protein
MHPHLAQLYTALERLDCLPNYRLEDFIENDPQEALSPWETWTLLSLLRHQGRQEWVTKTIQTKLGAEIACIAEQGSLGFPQVPPSGIVPDLLEWEYYFHGRGCRLTQRRTGETIDVDYYDETCRWIDIHFYVWYLESLTTPAFAEERLLALHGLPATVELPIQSLIEAEFLLADNDRPIFQFHPDCLGLIPHLQQLEKLWQDPRQKTLALASLGDWIGVKANLSADDPLVTVVEELAHSSQTREENNLIKFYSHTDTRQLALHSMIAQNHPQREDFLKQAIREEDGGTLSIALEAIVQQADAHWLEPVFALLQRLEPNDGFPDAAHWITAAEYLLRNGCQREWIAEALSKFPTDKLAEASILALEYAPQHALGLLRRALRSDIPYNRSAAAAVLAILDTPWSRRELMAVVQETDDPAAAAECIAGLAACHDQAAQQMVADWEERHPRHKEKGNLIPIGELFLATREDSVQYSMTVLHDRILPLRATRLPLLSPYQK